MRISIRMEGHRILYFYPFTWYMRAWNYKQLPVILYKYLRDNITIKKIAIESY